MSISAFKDGQYTGLQLKYVLKNYRFCVILDGKKKAFSCETTFNVGEIKDDSFKYDKKTNKSQGGFAIYDKTIAFCMFSSCGFEMKEYIADIEIPDSACVVVKSHNCRKSLTVDCVDVKKVYRIADSDLWNDHEFVADALREDINNLTYIEGKGDDFYKGCLDKYLSNGDTGFNYKLLDIIVRVGYKMEDVARYFNEDEITYIINKNEEYIKMMVSIPIKERRKMLKNSKFLRESYEKMLMENLPFSLTEDNYDSD